MDLLAAIRDPAFAGTPEKMRALLDLAGDAVEANNGERERLRAELADALKANTILHGLVSNRDAEIKRLRAALKPFTEVEWGFLRISPEHFNLACDALGVPRKFTDEQSQESAS